MKNKFDRILLGILWAIAVTLGTSFWFGSHYGFNLFSGAHWRYLAYIQASQTPIRGGFYTSLVLATIILIVGLYILLRPRWRKIRLPIIKTRRAHSAPRPAPARTAPSDNATTIPNTPNPIPDTPTTAPAETTAPATTPATPGPSAHMRPPRLNMGLTTMNNVPSQNAASMVTPTTPEPAQTMVTPPATPTTTDYPELREIFSDAGYIVKKNPKIDSVPISLFAIGTNENLWIGGVGIRTTELRAAIDKLSTVFSDTLEDIYINTNGFVINAPDAATSEFQDILMFDSFDALREYISGMPNPPVPDDDDGNFDAYSEYIDTVITYIGKV